MGVTLGTGQVAAVDLVVAQAATNRYSLTYQAGDPGYETPVDLTGWAGACQLRRSPTADTILAAAAVTLGGPDGTVSLLLTAAQTAGWDDVDGGVFDLYLTAPGPAGDVVRLAAGRFTVVHRVTRP